MTTLSSENSYLFEEFGYKIPEQNTVSACNETFVCGFDNEWHNQKNYKGKKGENCESSDTLLQLCDVYKKNTPKCIKYNDYIHCYESVTNMPDKIQSTGKQVSVPKPNKGSHICGFEKNNYYHKTILATSCDLCPSNLTQYNGQQCKPSLKTIEKYVSEKENNNISANTVKKNNSYSCKLSENSHSNEFVVKQACSDTKKCSIDNQKIVDTWVDSLESESDLSEFSINDVLNNILPLDSKLKSKCVLKNTEDCDQLFSDMSTMKQYLKEKIIPNEFVRNMERDKYGSKYGQKMLKEIQNSISPCTNGTCDNTNSTSKDYVYLNPRSDNKIEIKKLFGKNSLYINGKISVEGKNLVHCSKNNTCSDYTESINSIVVIDSNYKMVKPDSSQTVFKIVKNEDVFILDNEFSVSASNKEDANKNCSTLLCTINQNSCPSDYCKIDSYNTCVPSASASVHVAKMF
mgnify:CR=1 FL=1